MNCEIKGCNRVVDFETPLYRGRQVCAFHHNRHLRDVTCRYIWENRVYPANKFYEIDKTA